MEHVVKLTRFNSKFSRNCDKFTLWLGVDLLPSPHDLPPETEDVVHHAEIGLLSFSLDAVRVSVFGDGKVILKKVRTAAQAVGVAEKLLEAFLPQARVVLDGEDRDEY